VRLLFHKLDSEILSQRESKERRQKAHARQTRRADISRHYDRIVTGKGHPVVPVLAEFRNFPIVKALQDRDDVPPVSDTTHSPPTKLAKSSRILDTELKNSELIGGMIKNDLKKWVDTALVAFNSMLGLRNWKRASTKCLHPAERVSARFICTLCSKSPEKGATAESLNFREACAHRCVRHSKKAAIKQMWKADQFVPDKKVYVRSEGRGSPEANLLLSTGHQCAFTGSFSTWTQGGKPRDGRKDQACRTKVPLQVMRFANCHEFPTLGIYRSGLEFSFY
jgi:hypothetical protein